MTVTDDTKRVTLIPGDGIGQEVTTAACQIVAATGVKIEWELAEAGAEVFKKGLKSGVPKETIASLERTRLALKGPLETPVGYGEKSANVTLRKLFELFANIRPTIELPGIQGPYAGRKINFVVVRENVEDLYAGIEHMQTPGVAQCLKLMSRKGCEKIVRLAFELARAEGRHSVHCATKSNIMKLTEGFLKKSFEDVATEYPDIHAEHIIIDNCAHLMVRWPEQFEVIVTSNMNGDIISDLAAGLTGGLGLAPSANIGTEAAIFEAVHGSAPTIAGKNIANPTAMILSTVMLLRHLGEFAAAAQIEHAVVVTLEEGKSLTCDLIDPDHAASTTEFTETVIGNLGRQWDQWEIRDYKPIILPQLDPRPDFVRSKERYTCGMDMFIESSLSAEALGKSLEGLADGTPLRLKMISNRGTMRYPGGIGVTDPVDHWRCRFVTRDGHNLVDEDVIALLTHIAHHHEWMHIEKLQAFDSVEGFTKAQGED